MFGIDSIEPRIAHLKKLKNKQGEIIDNALVLSFKAPHSFTGEDIVEFHVHGSIAVVSEILEILSSIKGFRVADAGEFSRRSFENGKMDLLQAEGLADLIESETKAQRAQAVRQMEGEFSNIYEDWRTKIIEIMAFVEAYVDFPDEEIPSDLDKQAIDKIEKLITDISSQLNNNYAEKVRDGLHFVILGKPNAGKSTLINFLSKRELAIVSEIAGTTRDSLEAHFEINGLPIIVTDTAGLRETNDQIEKEGVRRALQKAENADFKIYIIDANDGQVDESLIDERTIVIFNKCDEQRPNISISNKNYKVLEVSLKERRNTEDIISTISEIAEEYTNISEAGIVTRQRHRALLNECANALREYTNSRKNNLPIELSAENLRVSAHAIGKIIGKIDVEDILDKIFSEFCIGK